MKPAKLKEVVVAVWAAQPALTPVQVAYKTGCSPSYARLLRARCQVGDYEFGPAPRRARIAVDRDPLVERRLRAPVSLWRLYEQLAADRRTSLAYEVCRALREAVAPVNVDETYFGRQRRE